MSLRLVSTRHEMLEAAAQVDDGACTPGDVSEMLHRIAGPAETVEEMFRRMEEYVAVAKEASKQGYVDLPEETCLVKPTPEQTKDDYPWEDTEDAGSDAPLSVNASLTTPTSARLQTVG